MNKRELYHLTESAVIDGLNHIKTNFDANKPDPWEDEKYHSDLKYEGTFQSGIPNWSINRKVYNYGHWLKREKDWIDTISWKNFRSYALTNESYRKHYSLERFDNENDPLLKKMHQEIYIERILAELIDHYIHKYKTKKFNTKRFESIFELWYKSLSSNQLKFNLWIPIIFTKFERKYYKIDNKISIQEIPNRLQAVRNLFTQYNLELKGPKGTLSKACSHAIVWKDWQFTGSLNNDSLYQIVYNIFEKDEFIKTLNNIIGSIRIITGFDIGYYQIFAEPVGWKRKFVAQYSSVISCYKEEYPLKYEKHQWNVNPDVITFNQLQDIRKIMLKLNSSKVKEIRFALLKLNSIMLRSKVDDIIFDTSVALEALLANDSRSEITYRLSTRGSYLSALHTFKNFKPSEIKYLLSKLYNYRSGVAHGEGKDKIAKLRYINVNETQVDLLSFAPEFLRFSLKTFLLDEKLSNFDLLESAIVNNVVK